MEQYAWVLALLLRNFPPGHTHFSVESAEYCMRALPAATCSVPTQYSSFYGGWVHQESEATGRARYELIAKALVDEATELLCAPGNEAGDQCVPDPDSKIGKKRVWDVHRLVVYTIALAGVESGFREDVQTGRGSANKASDDGGMGRGKAGEACFVQAHPDSAWRWANIPDDLRARAESGDKVAREAVMLTLVGTDEDSMRRCFHVGMRMLMHARAYCAFADKTTPWPFATYSLYGTGNSCNAYNHGKTGMRTDLYVKLYDQSVELRKPKKEVAAR